MDRRTKCITSSTSPLGQMFEKAGKHAFADMWMGGVRSAVYGGDMSPVGDMISGALSSVGNGYIDDGVDNIVLKIVSSAVLGGTISEIGGGKFANGAVSGAYSMLFNGLMHSTKTKNDKKNWGIMYVISNVDENVGLMDGHAWIRIESKDGKIIKTMSLWGNRGDQEYWEDLEIDAGLGVVYSSKNITASMYGKIAVYNSTPSNLNWTVFHTCAGYSASLWNYVTGENISATDIFNFTTPRALSKSLNIRNNPYKQQKSGSF